jgi:hypothetical protein
LQNGVRGVGQRTNQSHQCGVLRLVVRWTTWALKQLLGTED